MFQPRILISVALCILLGCIQSGHAENLQLVVTNSRLPVAGSEHGVVYDGDDAIYLVGGFGDSGWLDQVLKYTLSTGDVRVVSSYKRVVAGGLLMDGDDLIYVGGYGGGHFSNIDRISTVDGTWSRVDDLPNPTEGVQAAWDRAGGVAYLPGGSTGSVALRSILMFNASNNEVSQVGQLPEARYYAATTWDPELELAYIFGGRPTATAQDILKLDPASGVVTKLTAKLPYVMEFPTAVYALHNGQVYIFDTEELVSFDPVCQVAQRVSVDGWPRELVRPATVYVPKLARIYIFGGYGSYERESNRYRDEISYISFGVDEVSTTEPSMTTEATELPPAPSTEAPFCPPTGVHNFPYPGNCTLYIRCFNGVEQVLSCGLLLFDKIDLVCKPPSEAVCDEEPPIRCPPTGYETHPHPSSCSKYYECVNGDAYESDCAPNTYFDNTPELMYCNLAQHAHCNAECPGVGVAFLPIRARECKWYKVCVEGHSTNLECGAGEVYSPEESRCVPSDAYMRPYVAGSDGSEGE